MYRTGVADPDPQIRIFLPERIETDRRETVKFLITYFFFKVVTQSSIEVKS